MNTILFVYVFLLFVVLTPGILLSLPPKGSKWSMAIVHGLVFAFILVITYKYVCEFNTMMKPTIIVKHNNPK